MRFLQISLTLALFFATMSLQAKKSKECLGEKTFIFLKKGASGSGQKVRKFLVTKDALVWCKGDKFKGKYSLLNIDLLKSKPYQNGISYLYIKLKKRRQRSKNFNPPCLWARWSWL